MKQFVTLVISVLVFLMSPTLTVAKEHHSDKNELIPKIQVVDLLQQLQTAGYQSIHKIELEDGVYQVRLTSPQGEALVLHFNPMQDDFSKVIHTVVPKKELTMLEAAQKVIKEGYGDIREIKIEKEAYVVKALDAKKQKAKFEIDFKTGALTKMNKEKHGHDTK